ncbi:MAG TPA: hypothetical protein VMS11_03390 [Solirubrobacterales bacterium]|nr:hypothetical protein [Solirubrobacterales bacterium]
MNGQTAVIPVDQTAQDDAQRKIAAAEAEVARYEAEAEAVEVRTVEEAQEATGIVSRLSARVKSLEAERVELVKPLKDYTKGIDEKFKLLKAPPEAAVKTVKAKIVAFNEEAERQRRAEQRRLDEQREAREEEIRKRREAEEEEARATQAKAERERKEAEDLAAEDPDLADLVDEARDAERAAKTQADVISSLPEPSVPMATLAPAPKIEGASMTKRWEPRITDLGAVPAHLPDGEALIEVRSGPLRTYMHAYLREHGRPPEMPGIEFVQVSGMARR